MAERHRSYSVEYKLQVIDWYSGNGQVIAGTAREFGLDRKRVREWLKMEDTLRANSRGSAAKIRRLHAGADVCVEIDVEVLDFLLEERAKGRSVSNQDLKEKAVEIARNIQGMGGFKGSDGWLRRWKKRNHIAVRRGTNEAQKLPEEYADLIANFKSEIMDLRRDNDYTDVNIANMDQTMVRFDMASKTTNEERGSRDVRIATTGGAKRGFTVALCATASGYKKPAYIVFKERRGAIPARVLANLRVPANIRLTASQNGWMTGHKMGDWLERIWGPSTDDVRRLLVLDKACIHTMDATQQELTGTMIYL